MALLPISFAESGTFIAHGGCSLPVGCRIFNPFPTWPSAALDPAEDAILPKALCPTSAFQLFVFSLLWFHFSHSHMWDPFLLSAP